MSVREETEELRRQLERMTDGYEDRLSARYSLRYPPPERLGLYRRLRMTVGRLLRQWGIRSARPLEPWLPGLQHRGHSDNATPFLIWALGTERDVLRTACRRLASLQGQMPDRVPVLVTDVADFAFFSRLGWLVEYVPALAPPADKYAERKRQYLAWRYRGVPALPVSAGLQRGVRLEDLFVD